MIVRGRIRNGAVVLDEPARLPEGVAVRVEIDEPPRPQQSAVKSSNLAARLLAFAGRAQDLPADAADRHDDYLDGREVP